MCVCVTHVCMWMYRRQRNTSSVPLYLCLHFSLERESLTEIRARLAASNSPASTPHRTGVTYMCNHTLLCAWVLRIQTDPHAHTVSPLTLIHLPIPYILAFWLNICTLALSIVAPPATEHQNLFILPSCDSVLFPPFPSLRSPSPWQTVFCCLLS